MLSIFRLKILLFYPLSLFLLLSPSLSSEKGSPEYEHAIRAFAEENRKLNQLLINLKDESESEIWQTFSKDQKRWDWYREAKSNGFHHPKSRKAFTHYWVTASELTKQRANLLQDWKKSINAPWSDDWSGYYTCSLGDEDARLMIMHRGTRAWFRISVIRGSTRHAGSVMGIADINGNVGRYSDNKLRTPKLGETQSWLTMLRKVAPGEDIKLIESNAGIYHGVRASFDGHYIRRRGLHSAEKRDLIIRIKEWKEFEVETKKMQEKERLQDLAKVEGFLNQYTKSVDQCSGSVKKIAQLFRRLSHDKDKDPSYHQALKGNGQRVVDERYKYLENLPKDRLRVWLDSYDLYKEANNSVTYAIRPE